MAAPDYVPVPKAERARVYESPPWRDDSWIPNRPGDLSGRQPAGPLLGRPGPDQGYVLKLARRFEGTLTLYEGESEADALAGCTLVALKRASLFGRAPVVHDLRIALLLFGYLGAPEADLVQRRMPLFAAVSNSHHSLAQRRLADVVPDESLRLSPAEVERRAPAEWRSLVPALAHEPGHGGVPVPVPAEQAPPAPAEVVAEFGLDIDGSVEPAEVARSGAADQPSGDNVPGQEPVGDIVPGQEPVGSAPPPPGDIVPGQEPVGDIVPGQEPVGPVPAPGVEPEAAPPPPPPAAPVEPQPTPARPMVVRKGQTAPMSPEDEAAVSDLVARAKKALREQKRRQS